MNWASVPGHEFRLSLMGTRASCLADFYGAKLHLFRYDHAAKDTVLERTEDFSCDPQNELHHDMTGFLKLYLENIEPPRTRSSSRPMTSLSRPPRKAISFQSGMVCCSGAGGHQHGGGEGAEERLG
jgi:hypothetical protein